VHCCGFDSQPSDLGTHVMYAELKKRGLTPTSIRLVVGPSQGGVRCAVATKRPVLCCWCWFWCALSDWSFCVSRYEGTLHLLVTSLLYIPSSPSPWLAFLSCLMSHVPHPPHLSISISQRRHGALPGGRGQVGPRAGPGQPVPPPPRGKFFDSANQPASQPVIHRASLFLTTRLAPTSSSSFPPPTPHLHPPHSATQPARQGNNHNHNHPPHSPATASPPTTNNRRSRAP
jgi:hypothetical protein